MNHQSDGTEPRPGKDNGPARHETSGQHSRNLEQAHEDLVEEQRRRRELLWRLKEAPLDEPVPDLMIVANAAIARSVEAASAFAAIEYELFDQMLRDAAPIAKLAHRVRVAVVMPPRGNGAEEDRGRARKLAERIWHVSRRVFLLEEPDEEVQFLPADILDHGQSWWPEGEPRPVVEQVSDIVPEEVRWLWPGRIPQGKLTLIAGDPGLGKSLLSLEIAARATREKEDWPDDAPGSPPINVCILAAEDDPADTIRPRLEMLGADLDRVFIIQGTVNKKSVRPISDLKADLRTIESAIREHRIKLLIIDPISSYLQNVDTHRDADVRTAVQPIVELARRLDVTVIVVAHLNKGSGRRAIHRVGGSIAFVAAVRAAHLVVEQPQRPQAARLLIPLKSNVSAPKPSLEFKLEERGRGHPRLVWIGESDLSADDALSAPDSRNDRAKDLDDACEFLSQELEAGPQPAVELKEMLAEEGFSRRMIGAAKKKLGIRSRPDGQAGPRFWSLPDPANDPGGPD